MEQVEEIWKDVVGYEGLYQVSNLGAIKSISYKGKSKIRLMAIMVNAHGYNKASFSKEKCIKNVVIHRLVAEAFIPNNDNKPTVNHKDGNKLNNHVSNLEWATYLENNIHALSSGLRKPSDKQKQSAKDTFSKKVINIVTGEIFDSITIAGKMNNIKNKTLSCYLTGQSPNKTNLRYYEQ
jgi:hypothetical protein